MRVLHEGEQMKSQHAFTSFFRRRTRTELKRLFCDGCVGQNKNSVLPSMILYTLEHAKNLKKVTVNYFETNHGQNEGDCMHSVIERKVSKQPESMVPSQLATLIQTARATGKTQYTVYEINTVDVIDWKRHGQDIGLHAWRDALDGNSLVWTKVMSVALEKRKGECDMLFKHSHMEEFSVVSKPPKRQKDKYKSKTLPRPKMPIHQFLNFLFQSKMISLHCVLDQNLWSISKIKSCSIQIIQRSNFLKLPK
ncbi:hypothetical protein PoB_003347700 [Plakobranchus ocellatus]|uniref:Uncharacterized protein n=1 Tax=Plakobranchus ocellatus TaxID=259542 RepID=A0AAV4AJA3_9GAST|nr:hypothetical protein PoB_003347700 [Plakobranchus ocellatus]